MPRMQSVIAAASCESQCNAGRTPDSRMHAIKEAWLSVLKSWVYHSSLSLLVCWVWWLAACSCFGQTWTECSSSKPEPLPTQCSSGRRDIRRVGRAPRCAIASELDVASRRHPSTQVGTGLVVNAHEGMCKSAITHTNTCSHLPEVVVYIAINKGARFCW